MKAVLTTFSRLNLPVNAFSAAGELRLSRNIRRAAILFTTAPKTHRVRRPAAANSQYERALGGAECIRVTSGRPVDAACTEKSVGACYVEAGRCIILIRKESKRTFWLNCLFQSGHGSALKGGCYDPAKEPA